PYRLGAGGARHTLVAGHAKRLKTPLAYCNLVGGQDELVFDGGSFVMDANGEVTASAEYFREDILIADITLKKHPAARRDVIELGPGIKEKPETPVKKRRGALSEDEEVYEALTLGVRDYAGKNGFDTAVIALSGGVDSALTTAIAVDALGPDRVKTVYMPSPYSSPESESDAKRLTDGLSSNGVEMMTLPIGGAMKEYDKALADVFKEGEPGLAEENIQARIRGAMLMALSNKFGWLVLTTGNKSEIAVGYCTLYGDTVGGFAVIKDLFKTRVYRLCRWRNKKAEKDIIPQSIINKPPSAELRPGQLDTDSLPPYDLLDPILAEYIERDKNIDEIRKLGYSRRLVIDIIKMVDASEYKRRQGPLGVKITPKAFGRDRRTPVTCRFTDQYQ
ncbi:NAD synthetase / Glutamine amidotransferase chain of NAD synthetase, partial [hydrothermal vent metagenome]